MRRRIKYKTITISEKEARQLIESEGIDLETFPNAGPRPNITGMKQKYWGMDALCVKVGVYVYKVDATTYQAAGGEL